MQNDITSDSSILAPHRHLEAELRVAGLDLRLVLHLPPAPLHLEARLQPLHVVLRLGAREPQLVLLLRLPGWGGRRGVRAGGTMWSGGDPNRFGGWGWFHTFPAHSTHP